MSRESVLAAVLKQGALRSMTPPPGDSNPFSSSQDAGANPIDAALDKAARIAETLLKNIGPAESKIESAQAPATPATESTPPPAAETAPLTDAPVPADASVPADAPVSADAPVPADAPAPADGPAPADAPAPVEADAPDESESVADVSFEGTPLLRGEGAGSPLEVVSPAVPVEPPPTEPPPTEPPPTEPPPAVVPTTEDIGALLGDAPIEDQLERIEGLLDEAQAQIGGEAPAKDKPAAAAGIPFDLPPEMSFGDGDVPSLDDSPTEADIRFDDESGPGTQVAARGSSVRPRWLSPDTAFGQFVILLEDVFCGLLDRVDRPFVRVSYAARQMLGVCAVITLLAGIVTLILAYL